MDPARREIAAKRPKNLRPLGEWFHWAWAGLAVPGHTSYQFVRFCLVGAGGVLVNYLVMWNLHDGLGMHYVLASVGAFWVASVSNYIFNKAFTFRDVVKGAGPILAQYWRYLTVNLAGLAINEAVLVSLVNFSGMNPTHANLVGVLAATVANFLGGKFFAFRKPNSS